MAEIIKGDNTKGIKSVGELALRISRFDSYRLFTLYENVGERKVMDVSGNHKYYLVFKSISKEIRIPEYEPNGLFEVDKVNGCILFKITKKNAEDILGMKTGGERIFYIVRVFEEKDAFGKVLNVTDEVEVYHGKWGDDAAFTTFTTETKVDLLTKSLAVQVDRNAKQFTEYQELQEKYNEEVRKTSDLEKELEVMRVERDALQASLNEYVGDTHEGTLLSTDTKYIAFENTLENISFTEDQYSNAMSELMTKSNINLEYIDIDDPAITLNVKVYDATLKDLMITVYKNNISLGSAMFNQDFNKDIFVQQGDEFKFECTGMTAQLPKGLHLSYKPSNDYFNGVVKIDEQLVQVRPNSGSTAITGAIDYNIDEETVIEGVGNIGTLECYIK